MRSSNWQINSRTLIQSVTLSSRHSFTGRTTISSARPTCSYNSFSVILFPSFFRSLLFLPLSNAAHALSFGIHNRFTFFFFNYFCAHPVSIGIFIAFVYCVPLVAVLSVRLYHLCNTSDISEALLATCIFVRESF